VVVLNPPEDHRIAFDLSPADYREVRHLMAVTTAMCDDILTR
jgi:hypothetical protein